MKNKNESISRWYITTASDCQIKTITALGEMQHITSRLSLSMAHLDEFITEPFQNSTSTKESKKQIRLILKSTSFLEDRIKYVAAQ